MIWQIKPLIGKYYGTVVKNTETGEEINIWLNFIGSYRVSDREIKNGWETGDGYDHVELQRSYEAAVLICDALNKGEQMV